MNRVLIVEDDPQVAQINAAFLEQSGFELAGVAADAGQALKKLHEEPVQLILLDIYLPGSSGLQVLRQIRRENQQTEVIVVSAAKDSVQIREAFRMGCLDYIIKPFTFERLQEALNKFRQRSALLDKEFLEQSEVDLLASQAFAPEQTGLPKGIDKLTLGLVCQCLLAQAGSFGVQNVVEGTQVSRVSAKKYLDFLCGQKVLQQTYVYGNKGRPANLYQVTAEGRRKMQGWERE